MWFIVNNETINKLFLYFCINGICYTFSVKINFFQVFNLFDKLIHEATMYNMLYFYNYKLKTQVAFFLSILDPWHFSDH